jgi:hypothetical protein
MRNTKGGDGDGPLRGSRKSGEAGLYTVPRWEELMADPSNAGVLDAHTARVVAAKALRVFAESLYRLFEAGDQSDGGPNATPRNGFRTLPGLDDIASVEEVAGIIFRPRRWIIRNAAKLPFVTRVSRKHYVCSRIAVQRWLATRPRSPKGQ